MTDTMMWNLIVGFVSATFVLPVIQQPRWTEKTRSAVLFGYCVIVGLVSAYLTGAFALVNDIRAGASSILTVLVAAVASYKGFAKPIGIAPSIEAATSGASPPAASARS